MATNILNQVYKEAKVTSKGVIQMNRTLDKIYEDQEKGNRRQDKFLTDLRNRQRREEREEKKRQSDLKKLIAGNNRSASGATKDKDDKDGLNLAGMAGGLVPAITGGLKLAFGLFKTLLIAGLAKKLAGFLGFGGRGGSRGAVPPTTGGGRGGGRRGGNNGGGGNRGGQTQPGGRKVPEVAGGEPRGGNKGGTKVKPKVPPTGTSPLQQPGNANNIRPIKRVPIRPSMPWWKKIGNGIGGVVKGARNFLGKWAGPLITFALMAPDMKMMFDEKRYKDLTRYVLSAIAGSAVAGVASTAVTALAALAGIPTGGAGGIAVFLTGMGAAMGAGSWSANKVDELLFNMGLADEDQSTGQLPNEIPQIENVDELERANTNIDEYKDAYTQIEAQKKQRGGGIFDVPGHGQGDQVPMMLPPGAFVLNRVAAQEMFARGGSPSGMVPTLLEPGEKVFMPGDPLMDMAMSFNNSFSRFQTGGMVGQPTTDSSSETITDRGLNQLSGKGGSQAVVSVGQMLLDEGFTVKEHPNFAGRSFDKSGKARVGGHSQNSLHYKNLAIDVTDWREGAWQQRTATLAEKMYRQRKELNLTQIIHDPWGAWFAGEGQKGPGIGGHETHLHLGFATGPASDKGYVGEGNENTPGNKDNSTGGLFGAIGGAVSNIFSPVTEAISGAMGDDGPMGQLFNQIGEVGKQMFSELNSPEVKQMMADMGGKISKQVGQMQLGSSMSDQHMKTIREAQDPEANGDQTVIQVVPEPSQDVEPTISGTANDNVPPGLTLRCSSWASADYRYDRSLNCETL